ncbi:transposase [Streptomyces sp. SA15]|uniref:DDE-type integrase/transposase/recombinase n=1 Tax=Streptomyces sp. SA15 TaxID=934019 RepID=UPI000BAF0347|nr:DDE-type integrase/transposase/recombinase [Streptomyces sp. SA15]PAZ16493.1 transposase [Streptomyces sp. SA15]
MNTAAVLDLSPGAGLVLDGTEWTVERREPHLGRVQLVRDDGTRERVSLRFLVNHLQCRSSSQTSAEGADRGRQRKAAQDLREGRLELAQLRMAHLLEVATGFRSGDPLRPGPDEPKPEYDPATTTLTERRLAKVAELAAMDPHHAKLLGLGSVGYRTLIRWENARRRFGLVGCADDRWLRQSGGTRTVSEEVREAVLAVRQETQRMAKVSMRTKDRMIRQYVREEFGPETKVPGYDTLRRLWKEWFGPGGARQRYARSADLPEKDGHVLVHRPGQVVALDTTVLPVMVREHVFGDPVKMHLTLALDVCTHSLVAFRLTLVSDTSVDVAMVLRDVTMPLPMRADWGEDLEWPYPGIPAAVVAEFAGHQVAGLPFFTPETVTTDHGSVYRNHHLVEVQRVLGCNILPARVLRPQDKAAVERAFGVIRQLLFEHLIGYTGIDVADRGADPAADAVLTADQLEHTIATWIVAVWQKRKLGEYAPSWDPDGSHSPNSLFAASFAQTGFAMDVPSPELFYELLPAHYVRIDKRRGVKIRGLWYDDPDVLRDYRGELSTRGGRHKGQWLIRRDPRDRRQVFFQDPISHAWHPLPWTGMPQAGQMPAFGDTRASDLLRKADAAGLKPKSDTELLPVLLELIGSVIPVSKWPNQLKKSQRVEHSREAHQADAAQADRPPGPSAEVAKPAAGPEEQGQQAKVLNWPGRARQTQDAVAAERRRRREAAGPEPAPPPQLGHSFRTRNVFVLPEEDDLEEDRGGPDDAG